MNTIVWDDRFLLGLREIDEHHRHLFALLAKAHQEFLQGEPDLERTLDELVRYSRYHFEAEESLMIAAFYADFANHKREHRLFIQKVNDFKDQPGTSQYRSLKAIMFLEEWIADHILKMDATLGAHLAQGWDQFKTTLKPTRA